MRQLTHLELILDMGGRTREVLELFTTRKGDHGDREELYASDNVRRLDERRRAYWEEAGDLPRAPVMLPDRLPDSGIRSGGGWEAQQGRTAARKAAEHAIRDAWAMWQAAGTEESWRAWQASRGR